MLTPHQHWAICADLSIIRSMGFSHVRILTTTKGGDPAYAAWPAQNFLTFPCPTPGEVENLRQFLALTAQFGLTSEVVIVMADAGNRYYQNGVTCADYRLFLDTIWPALWGGLLNRVYLGGDLRLGDHDDPAIVPSHRQFILDLWPHLVSLCPTCGFGLEIQCQNATFVDRGLDSLAWIKAHLCARLPGYIGGQLYPTSHVALRALGFEHNGVVNWAALTRDWATKMVAAAAPMQFFADEIGCAVGTEFTAADQAAFLQQALSVLLLARGVKTNVWEFADHPGIGDLGLLTVTRDARPAVGAIRPIISSPSGRQLLTGIAYTPPEFDDLAWLMPGGP